MRRIRGGYGGMLRLILGVKTATDAAASEIKGAADTCRIAGVHQPLKDVEGIALVQRCMVWRQIKEAETALTN